MKYAFLFLTYLICSAVSIWGTLHLAPQASAAAIYEAEGQRDWPYYANYSGSYSRSSGVPINRVIAMGLNSPNMHLGVKEKPDVKFPDDSEFKDRVRGFAIAVLKYPKAPVYMAQTYFGIMLCLGDYGNLAEGLVVANIPNQP